MAHVTDESVIDTQFSILNLRTLRCGIAPSYPTLVVTKSRVDLILIETARPGNGAGLATNYLYFNMSSTVVAGGAGTQSL